MRQVILNLAESRIREVANAGMGRSDVLAFWFGESDEVTPDVIRQAAIVSLQKGETFYSQNLGLPELRQAIACVQVQARAFTLQSLTMTPPKQRCRQGVDVPGMHFLKLDQPFGGQHPACTAADQHQLTAWHGLRQQPI